MGKTTLAEGRVRRFRGHRPCRCPGSAALFLGLLLLLCLGAACAATGRGISVEERLAGVSPEFQPALMALRAAVNDHEDETARDILERLLARKPLGEALDLAQGFERILAGRAAVADLVTTLVLESREPQDGSRAAPVEVFQVWVNLGPRDVELRPGPTSRRLTRESLDARGHLVSRISTEVLAGLGPWVLPAGGAQRRSLGVYPLLVPGDCMAARTTFLISHLPGFVLVDGRELPAQTLPHPRASRTVLASFLPQEAVTAQEWMDWAGSPRAALAPLLERTVRLSPSAAAEVLEALGRDEPNLGRSAWQYILPALRWLVPERREFASANLWRAELGRRAAARPRGEERSRSLDMPAVPR